MTPSPKDIASHRQDTTAPAREILEHIYKAVLAVPAFTLQDGTTAQISKLGSPDLNADGDLTCSFDVDCADGSDLEFTVNNTGWGRPIGAALAAQKPGPTRGR
jgi:hypothetical protein